MCEARNFAACTDEICGARREIFSIWFEGGFSAAQRRSKIYSAKYDAKFYVAAHGDKIYGAMADDKIFDVVSARAGNFELQNACVNLRPRNTYADLKFRGSANSESGSSVNFKFKEGVSFRFLCGGNAKSLKSRNFVNALSFSDVAEISALIRAGEILKYGVTAGISALALVGKILIPSAAGKILSLNAVPRADFGLKGAGGC